MIPDPDTLAAPDSRSPAELLDWRPKHGVLSLYIRIDPGDRSEAWRTAVRNGLSEAVRSDGADSHDFREALDATASRLQRELLDGNRKGEHRGLIGFVEIAAGEGEERWYATQIPPRRIEVRRGTVASVHQLIELLDDGAPLGVAAISSERVRLLDWRLGRVEQLHDWELEYFAGDWKERKAPRPRDPTHAEGISSSGRDQYDQRLEATRERFAVQAGELARGESRKRGWRQAVAFGDERYARRFSEGFGNETPLVQVDADLVTASSARIEQLIEETVSRLNRAREAALIERIKEAAYAEGRSSLGIQETLQALGEGRVEHVVYDADREYGDLGFQFGTESSENLPLVERIAELALSTGAQITPVEGDSAEALGAQEGVAALLRY